MTSNILVFNSGSSSLRFQVIQMPTEKVLVKGIVDDISGPNSIIKINDQVTKKVIRTQHEAITLLLDELSHQHLSLNHINAVVHRVVHGGEDFKEATIINQKVIDKINSLSELAPLHNPRDLECIKIAQELLPKVNHFAVFDTSFHQSMPEESYLYAIPKEYYQEFKIRKYGFHGSSHKYIVDQTKKILKKSKVNIISCHLGNGASVCAIKDNSSIDTSMGFTPLPGLIMGQRSGDIDPELVVYLAEKLNIAERKVIDILNNESGLLALAGHSDYRVIHQLADKGDKKAILALKMFTRRLVFYIGGYQALLGNVDAIVFTGAIGQGAWYTRQDVANQLNIQLDKNKNEDCFEGIISKSNKDNKPKIIIITTNEELQMARDVFKIIK